MFLTRVLSGHIKWFLYWAAKNIPINRICSFETQVRMLCRAGWRPNQGSGRNVQLSRFSMFSLPGPFPLFTELASDMSTGRVWGRVMFLSRYGFIDQPEQEDKYHSRSLIVHSSPATFVFVFLFIAHLCFGSTFLYSFTSHISLH